MTRTHGRGRRGFTLIELLVVIGIIGLLSTLAVVALSSARRQAREAKRVSDMKSLQSALEIYSTTNNGYPASAAGGAAISLASGASGDNACLTDAGWVTLANCGTAPLIRLSAYPTPGPATGASYSYSSCATAPCSTYSVTFNLEGTFGDFKDGTDSGTDVNCSVGPSLFKCD
ncbi:type II secretion system protein [Candidatus Uhrbacteria bacterium]|nr:type II secretion system protein [Candidatus Uhrbacteria bacterium]